MLYVLTSASGALLAWNADAAQLPTPPANSLTKGLSAWDAPPELPYRWDALALDWAITPTASRTISRQTFVDRFPDAVQQMVHTLELENSATGASVRSWILRLNIVPNVVLTDNRTIASVNGLIGLAVAKGVVASADMAATIAAILA